jgi:PBP4 family serine-type D-alanyl-D-alanine carboxypeptidase
VLFGISIAASALAQPYKGEGPPAGVRLPATPGRSVEQRAIQALGRDIDRIISDRAFADASWSVSVVSCTEGDGLYRYDDLKNRQVASNMKLLTTAAALRRLGGEYHFSTDLFLRGELLENGEFKGDLVVRTVGDPSMAPEFGTNVQEMIAGWAHLLDSLGIRSIDNIIVDASYFDNIPYAPGWSWDDEAYGFNAPISAAAIYQNAIEVTVTPAKTPGRSVSIDIFPATSYVTLKVNAVTSRSDSTSTLDIRRERGSGMITVAGNIGVGSEPYTEKISIERPPLFFGTLMREEFERLGMKVRGGIREVTEEGERPDYPSLRRIGYHRSPALREIIAAVNKLSLNLPTEMLLKKLGRDFQGAGSTAAGLDVIRKVLTEAGVDAEHPRLFDGSGLSRQNMITPAEITTFLRWVQRSSIASDFRASLSIAGEDGTLAGRMKGTLAAGNVFAKTGFLGGIRAVSGYVRTRDGEWLAISIVINNYSVSTSVVNTATDLILMRLAAFSRKA